MKKILIILILTTVGLYSCGQSEKPIPTKVTPSTVKIDSIIIDESNIKTKPYAHDNYIHTEATYTDTTGKGVIIQNGFPRGGGLIYSAEGTKHYGHAVFWTRVVNKTEKALTLNIHFPADSLIIYPSPHAHFKLLVPPDTMTLDKVSKFSYDLKNIDAFVASNFYQPSYLERTIPRNEASSFYVILLSHLPTANRGVSRTGLFLKEQTLFYRLSSPLGVKLLPCGRIKFKD